MIGVPATPPSVYVAVLPDNPDTTVTTLYWIAATIFVAAVVVTVPVPSADLIIRFGDVPYVQPVPSVQFPVVNAGALSLAVLYDKSITGMV